jgi:hypothetical protein
VPKNNEQNQKLSDEEIEIYLKSIDDHIWENDDSVPHWLWCGETLAYSEDGFEYSQTKPLSPTIKQAFSQLRVVVSKIRKAYELEHIDKITEEIFHDYYLKVEDEWADAVSFRDQTLKAARKRLQQGKKMGHAAFDDNWQNYWEDKWLQRRANNKGWQYSANDILNELPAHIVIPDQSTISRYRNKLFIKISDK